jgi:predicted transcriptional regulator
MAPLSPEPRSITTMRLPTDLLRELTRIAFRRGVSRTKLVEAQLYAFIEREKTGEVKFSYGDPFA